MDLFLNLGSAQLENGELDTATESLQRAVLLTPDHFESHYNLALAFERRGLRADAEHEILASLRLNPEDADARNTLGVIYAEEGKVVPAALVWRDLVREFPAYEPARANLALLGSHTKLALGEAAVTSCGRRQNSRGQTDNTELGIGCGSFTASCCVSRKSAMTRTSLSGTILRSCSPGCTRR